MIGLKQTYLLIQHKLVVEMLKYVLCIA